MKFPTKSVVAFLCVFGVCAGEVAACDSLWRNCAGNSRASSRDSYLFPTDASHQINSGFGDYRESHFHAGIDISTNGKIGYPVHAAKFGYVYRVSVSPFGYGKMVVLRHRDSTFTVYAHLSGFSKAIEQRVKAAQEKDNKYGIEVRFQSDEIKVSRGEVIAYTGATGVGGPHLHFEIRDKNYSPIDPLIYTSLNVSDYRTPRIFNVAVRGFLSATAQISNVTPSRVGGKGMKTVPASRDVGSPKNEYRTTRTFYQNEPFYFVIHAADSYGRGKFKRPPKYIALKIDGKNFVSLDLTRINVDDYLDVSSLVDLDLSRGFKTYYALCVDRAIPFSVFTPDAPLSGLVGQSFANGMHTYEISVGDEDGNKALVRGKFVLDIAPRASSAQNAPITIAPFKERVMNLSPALTLRFPANCFAKDVNIEARQLSSSSFEIGPETEMLRKKVEATWKVGDPKLRLFRRIVNHRQNSSDWSYVACENDGKILTAEIGYKIGQFALLLDGDPPVVERIRFSKKNPFYRSVAPPDFSRVFVYFRVSDRLSGIDTDDILLKVGKEQYLCEYDVDKHAAICQVDANLLRREKKVEVVVRDNAGNERRVVSRVRMDHFGTRLQ